MHKRDTSYSSFLVRLWQERSTSRPENAAEPAVWRFSVEDPRTGERQGFAKLSALVAFLQAQMDSRVENGTPLPQDNTTDASELGSAPPPIQSGGVAHAPFDAPTADENPTPPSFAGKGGGGLGTMNGDIT